MRLMIVALSLCAFALPVQAQEPAESRLERRVTFAIKTFFDECVPWSIYEEAENNWTLNGFDNLGMGTYVNSGLNDEIPGYDPISVAHSVDECEVWHRTDVEDVPVVDIFFLELKAWLEENGKTFNEEGADYEIYATDHLLESEGVVLFGIQTLVEDSKSSLIVVEPKGVVVPESPSANGLQGLFLRAIRDDNFMFEEGD